MAQNVVLRVRHFWPFLEGQKRPKNGVLLVLRERKGVLRRLKKGFYPSSLILIHNEVIHGIAKTFAKEFCIHP